MPPIHSTDTSDRSRAVYDALIPIGHGILQARLSTPISPGGWVIMGCSRRHHPPAMQDVPFGETGLATMCLHLLPSIDVLPSLESEVARQLTQQLILAARWLRAEVSESHIPIGLFGAYQDAAIALSAAAFLGSEVGAVVSYQGSPDKSMNHLPEITAPTLLLVNEGDDALFTANVQGSWWLHCTQQLTLVPGWPRLLRDRSVTPAASRLAGNWYRQHLLGRKPIKAFPGQLFTATRVHDRVQETIYH